MRVGRLKTNPETYSSNAYLLRGNFNSLKDLTTLIDTGGDDFIIKEIEKINTGAGKKKIDQVILTHNHFDHSGGLKALKEKFNPLTLAFTKNKNIDKTLKNKQIINVADTQFQVIYCPIHSNDSILLYNWEEKILFSGDTPLIINTTENSHNKAFLEIFDFLLSAKIETIYPGHGQPIYNAQHKLKRSYKNLQKSKLF